MKQHNNLPTCFALAVLSCGGCTTISPKAGMNDVERSANERFGMRVEWIQDQAEDDAVRQTVQSMLASELSVDAAVQISLLNNPALQAEYEKLAISQADLVQAGLIRNPVFSGFARFPDRSPSATNVELGIVYDFLDVLMRAGRMRLAATQFEQTRASVTHRVIEHATQTKAAFYGLQAAQQVEDVSRTIVDAGATSLELAARMNAAGNLSELALANEQALLEQARLDLAGVLAERLEARERMNRLLGVWGQDTGWKIGSRLPNVPGEETALEHLESEAVRNRFDLAGAKCEVDALSQSLEIARTWRWGTVAEIGVSGERDSGRQWTMGPTLSVEIPIFDQRQAVIARLEAELRESQNRLAALAIGIRSEVRSIRQRMLIHRDVAKHFRDVVVPLRERIVSLSQEQYNFMLIGAFELISARQREREVYRQFISAVRDYWIARSQLEAAIGRSMSVENEDQMDVPPKHELESSGHRHGG